MAVLVWIVAVLLGLGLLIGLTRVGIHAQFTDEGPVVHAAVGPLRFRIFPGKDNKKADAEKASAADERSREEETRKKKKTSGKRPSFGEIRALIKTLWPPLKKALARTRRSIRITPLQLSITLAGEEDPAAAAQLYGDLQAAVWTVMPALEQLLVIRDPHIHMEIDFDGRANRIEGSLGLSIRIGSLLKIAMGLAVPAVSWYLRFRKTQTDKQTAEPTAAAGTTN